MKTYQHIEKLDSDEVDGILNGTVYLFTKLDGTNAGVSFEDGKIVVCSRKRDISIKDDNAGTCAYIMSNQKFSDFFNEYPDLILYGEFLVKHTIRTYIDDAWRKFYVFDVYDKVEDKYLTYEEYLPMLAKYGILYIPLIARLENPTEEEVMSYLSKTSFLQPSDDIPGEGLVIHAPGFVNKYGRTTWAKVVRAEYKARKKHRITISPTEDIEAQIINDFCTDAFVEKEIAKLYGKLGTFENSHIGRYIATIYHEFIVENAWDIVKKYKNPKIDFKIINSLCTDRIKSMMIKFFKELGVNMPWA